MDTAMLIHENWLGLTTNHFSLFTLQSLFVVYCSRSFLFFKVRDIWNLTNSRQIMQLKQPIRKGAKIG